jgi:RNA-directed DNA polymerase
MTATSLRGKFTIHLRTMKKRLRRAIKATAAWCQDHRHYELAHQWMILTAKLRGHYQYYGRPTNYRSLWQFYRVIHRLWYKWLNRRTRGKTLKWKDYARILQQYPLPRPKITRAWMPAR